MRGSRKCGGCARRTSTQHGGPDASERQLVPGRSWAAWARALGHLLPPLRVADLGCGEGYLTDRGQPLGVAGHRRRSVATRCSSAPARWRAGAASRNVTWKRGELEKLPLADATRGRGAAVAGAAPRRRSRRAPSPKPRASSCPAAACCCSICASTTRPGCASGSAIAGSASRTTQLASAADAAPGSTDVKVTRRRAARRRSVHRADRQRHASRRRANRRVTRHA